MTDRDDQTIRALRGAMAAYVRDRRLDPATVAAAVGELDRRRTPRRLRQYLAVAAACLLVAGLAVGIHALREKGTTRAAGSACVRDGAVVTTALPDWARAGFSGDSYDIAHVTGAGGGIVGILFGDLHSPPLPRTNNKILWVAQDPGYGPLVITAQLEGSSRVVTRTVPGGPGPSIIDVPSAGCWQATLTWDGSTDAVALPYTS